MADERIDYSRFTGSRSESGGRVETEGVSRQLHPERETRPRGEIERYPDYHQRANERAGNSNWSGGSWGGRSRE